MDGATPSPRIVGRRTLVPGPKYAFEELTIENPGNPPRVGTRCVVAHPGAVVVVPLLSDGRLVLIRNFRVAVEGTGAWVLEFCAGTLDVPGEDPADCARRELVEECGYRADAVTALLGESRPGGAGYFYTTPGLTSERMFPFVAAGLTHVAQDLEENELIETVVMTPREAWAAVDAGGRPAPPGGSGRTLMDAKSIVALTLATRRGLVRI